MTNPLSAEFGLIPQLTMLALEPLRLQPNTGLLAQSVRSDACKPVMASEDDTGGDYGSGTVLLTRTKVKKPNLYRVLLLNDDYTPMEFVVYVLERFFNKSIEEATEIMLHVHQTGVGQCGVFTYEVAETKVTMVMDFARKHQHPLQCVMEKS